MARADLGQDTGGSRTPAVPVLCPNRRRVSGRKARDFLKTQGHRPGAEAAGSCPWWRRAWARRAAGSPPPGAPGLSPDSGVERLAPGSPSPGCGCSQALANTSKVILKGSSHLWAGLAARSRSQDLKPAAGGAPGTAGVSDPWGTAAVAEGAGSESVAEDLGALSTFFESTCVPPGPLQSVAGPRPQRGELETWPRPWPLLSQVPAFPPGPTEPFLEPTLLARDHRALFQRCQVWALRENIRRGPRAV